MKFKQFMIVAFSAIAMLACSSGDDISSGNNGNNGGGTTTPPAVTANRVGWPADYDGVMLQGFYWDSFTATKWTNLESQAKELGEYFDLVWIPQSANCGNLSMGYDDLYWFSNYDSSFGTKAELVSMIKTFKNNGIGTIADVVINHRKNVSSWVDFPSETYNGVTYTMTSTDICADDDGGKTKTWAASNGFSLSGNPDTGEGWDGMRDLDHNSANVQACVKAYLGMLIKDLGYTGFRYDMVKGYSGTFTGTYNVAANPTYSVGEYWDGDATKVKTWLNSTKVDNKIQSAAFDFPFRYTVRDAVNNDNWSKLRDGGVATDDSYKQYAVTFIENHDTEYRSASSPQDPIKKNIVAGNAYLLAMPGTPCVFLKHWIDYKQDIKAMIEARKMAGITNTSKVNTNYASGTNYIAILTTGTKSDLLAVIGSGADSYTPDASWLEVAKGENYRYLIKNNVETAWADLASGEYEGVQTVKLSALSSSAAQLVYTTDGSTPTASSTAVASGTSITIPVGTTVLKVGLLINGVVSKVITRNYTVIAFSPYSITVYVKSPGWAKMYFHSWGTYRTGTTWPGTAITATKVIDGETWYYNTYDITKSKDKVNFVFNVGDNTTQTVDVTDVDADTYFEILSTKDSQGHFEVSKKK